MPIDIVDLPGTEIPRVTILDEAGRVDASLEPDIPEDDLRELYRVMLLARAYDDQRLRLQRQGRIGTFAPVKGQEAAQLGSVYAIRETDWMVPAFRETAAALWRGADMEDDLAYCAGREEGVSLPEDARELPIAIPVASQLPHAVGVAWARKLQGAEDVVLTYFGDGATSEGDFHEAMNFATVYDAPVVFLCQNNQWAISVPREKQTRSRTLAQKAIAYDAPGVQVDGNDLLATYHATREAVERARRGDGPTLIEAVTYRLSVHTTADDPTKYRSPEEVTEWDRRDPLPRFRAYLEGKGLLDADAEARASEDAKARVRDAVRRFEARGSPDPLAMFEDVYAELPAYTRRQRDGLARHLAARGERGKESREARRPALESEPSAGATGVPDPHRFGRARERGEGDD